MTLESERLAVASALLDPLAADRICEILKPEDFLDPKLATIFTALHDLSARRADTGPAEIIAATSKLGIDPALVLELAHFTVVSGAHARAHALVVLEAAQLRRIASISLQVAKIASDTPPEKDAAAKLIDEIRIQLDALQHREQGKAAVQLHKAEPDLLPRILENIPVPRGIKTYFHDLDDILGGLRKGEMIVLAARPSVGKSLLAANIAESLAIRDEPVPSLIVSCEMSASSLYRRALFGRSQVDADIALAGNANEQEKRDIQKAHQDLAHANIQILAGGPMTPQRIRAAARRLKAQHEQALLVIDYLQLLHGEGRSIYERVTELSKHVKDIATDLDIPVLLLSQLSRNAAESRERDGSLSVKRPTLSDLRDSGAIEQDADAVIFLSRDITKREPHPCDLDIAKNRPATTGHTQLLFNTRGPRFENQPKCETWNGRN